MHELEPLIRQARHEALIAAVTALSDRQRREVYDWLKATWPRDGETLLPGLAPRSPSAGQEARLCALIGAVLTAKGVPQALAIPLAPPGTWVEEISLEGQAALVRAVAWRGRDFAAELVTRCAVGKRRKPMCLPVLTTLIDAFDLPMPEDPEFLGWLGRCLQASGRMPYSAQAGERPFASRTLVARRGSALDSGRDIELQLLDTDSIVTAAARTFRPSWTLSALLAMKDGVCHLFASFDFAQDADRLARQVAGLVATGELDRTRLADDLLGALIRGDSTFAQRMQIRLLLAIEPGLPWVASHADALVNLLASGQGAVAEGAQHLLRQLDLEQPLSGETFVTCCRMIFSRKEKGLRDTQLAWGLRRAEDGKSGTAPDSLRGLLEALGVADHAFLKRCLGRLQTLWNGLAAAAREDLSEALAAAAAPLEPALREELAAWSGASIAPGPGPCEAPGDISTPGVVPAENSPLRPFVPIACDDAAIAEAGAAFRARQSVLSAEQLIDAVVRRATSPDAAPAPRCADFEPVLIEAMQLPWALQSALEGRFGPSDIQASFARGTLAQALLLHGAGESAATAGHKATRYAFVSLRPLVVLARMRFGEVVHAVACGRPYPLLSRPSWDNGAIEAGELVERLARLAQASGRAGPMDLLLALTRTASMDGAGIQALRRIASHEALIAADFFEAGGLAGWATRLEVVSRAAPGEIPWSANRAGWRDANPTEVCVSLPRLALPTALSGIPTSWAEGFTPVTAPDIWEFDLLPPYLTGVMPRSAEILAALYLWGFRLAAGNAGSHGGSKATAMALPQVIAARGEAGPALHLALLFCLSATDPAARIVAVDGLLELVAQDRFQPALCAGLAVQALRAGSLKVTRLAATLGQAADAGAATACWPLLRQLLDEALAQVPPPPGCAELAALASRLLPLIGDRRPLAGVVALAGKRGDGKLVLECRRLLALMTG